ncbi:hypothetical protein [Mucilaginibacter gotjawali]|uniref:Uncharacterized protein n=2 Tax=Mucilaginibacter gotjawali TaxID=1550579 RepID=A0A839SA65_9SPHI|nr:hypothetical protein [Mucilaginibacter gotjawali]MBB3053850.1 hypothetical protein [Mucilaginibacter gotjawali]BAU54114.1 hypothetical protein MgSA37_02286 [Mucilaginibacter gotjawali]
MKPLLFLFGSFFISSWTFAQISLDINGRNIAFFRQLETNAKGELVKTDVDYVSADGTGQPVIYKRIQNGLPDLWVYYFPLKKDSLISYVLYEWQDKDAKALPLEELKPYLSKYTELLGIVTAKYGKSLSKGNLDDLALIDTKGLTRNDTWRGNDYDIEMYITLSNLHVVHGNVSITPTHTIRLYVRRPGIKSETPGLTKEKIAKLDSLTKLFLADVCSGKWEDSRVFLSPLIIGQVKDEKLIALKAAIKDDKWELNMSGAQLASSGKAYSNLRYARQGDTNTPPLEWLSIVFDDDNKIIAVQPLTRSARQ